MQPANCFESCMEGGFHRLGSPLPSGLYKIQDFRDQTEGWREELVHMRWYVAGLTGAGSLSYCTVREISGWIKRLPGQVAYDLGFMLFPALDALQLDGIPLAVLRRELPAIKTRGFLLLRQLDEVARALGPKIATEYELMRRGAPRLEPLLERAVNLGESALQLESWRPPYMGSCE